MNAISTQQQNFVLKSVLLLSIVILLLRLVVILLPL